MKLDKVKRLSPLERFLYWIKERHNIFVLKSAKVKKPWTDDEILQQYFFTNPYRENDKVTQWVRSNIRDPLYYDPKVLFALTCFRWFNLIETGVALSSYRHTKGAQCDHGLLERWICSKAIKLLTDRQLDGEKVFTGAFTISPSGSTKPKIERVCEDYITPVWANWKELAHKVKKGKTMENAFNALRAYPGLAGGGFMAYEVVCDLRYTGLLEMPPDRNTWTNLGPGGIRGLNRLMDRPLESPKPRDWLKEMVSLLKTVRSKLPNMPKFEMREIEHSLCEYDKYERALFGQGHMKRRYNGCSKKGSL